MFKNQPNYKIRFLQLDVVIISLSFLITASVTIEHFWGVRNPNHMFRFYYSYFAFFMMSSSIGLFCLLYNDMYKRNIITSVRKQSAAVIKSVAAAVVLIILILLLSSPNYLIKFGRSFIVNYAVISTLMFIVLRVGIARYIYLYLARHNVIKIRVLLVGGDAAAVKIAKSLEKENVNEFEVVGFLDDYKKVGEPIYKHHLNKGKLEDLSRVAEKERVDEILIAIDNTPYERMMKLVDSCLATGKVVRIHSNFLNVIADKLRVEFYHNIPVVKLSQYPVNDFLWNLKRGIDFMVASALIIIFLPVFAAIAVGIKISSQGPIIYRQERIGKNGKPFTFYKFRSMVVHNDDRDHEKFVKEVWFGKSDINQPTKVKIYKMTNDPRVFTFGRFIRKTSLDEFPQLFNVLKGEMGIVGPRPCMPFEWEMYSEWHRNRLVVTPGCTGLWQVLGRAKVSFEEMVIMDLYYISNMTLWLDLKILLNTIPVIVFGRGGF